MIVVSTIGKMHESIPGYDYKELVNYIKTFNKREVLVSYLKDDPGKYDDFTEISYLKNAGFDLYFIGEELYRPVTVINSPESLVRSNLIDMINTMVYSYLKGYWKDAETVNSEFTDRIFSAKHKFIMSVEPDIELKYWVPMHKKIMEKAENKDAILLSDVESAYFYRGFNQ
ncbi:hypothetical protein [Picrophilus oshimae]|uniref:Uncharacterized protein n=1 Tax=Picrophilus torridus (strain ATCC 700027 / DSM 9790 / JCM 10055 / NBRC 100828 / KAW 2/3) TaxID=1122961 RepID=Q6KZJ1_PICTO|nr:hypothetical protein [Picrophilus oshimae]AAT43861.1 hypothetical protein PTO1276 [Picrophilus oshimae DSM 9789]SMD31070.1 hypothetical protein SAMN02745355_0989 [Picrophilus oshimae DSM 9789]